MSQLLASWAWGPGELPGLTSLVAVPGTPPLPKAAGHDLVHILLPPPSPPTPSLHPDQEGPRQLISESGRTHFPWEWEYPQGSSWDTHCPSHLQLGWGHGSICPWKPPNQQGAGGQGASRKKDLAWCPALGKGLAFFLKNLRPEKKLSYNNSSLPFLPSGYLAPGVLPKWKLGFWPPLQTPSSPFSSFHFA